MKTSIIVISLQSLQKKTIFHSSDYNYLNATTIDFGPENEASNGITVDAFSLSLQPASESHKRAKILFEEISAKNVVCLSLFANPPKKVIFRQTYGLYSDAASETHNWCRIMAFIIRNAVSTSSVRGVLKWVIHDLCGYEYVSTRENERVRVREGERERKCGRC